MNLDNSIWSAVGHPWDYVNAYRHVQGIFHDTSRGFTFDWCPNSGTQRIDPEQAYPGDDVVDIIGVDYYDDNWGNSTDRWNWNMDGDNRGLAWQARFASDHHKHMSFPEFGAGKGGDDPYFINKLYDWVNSHDVVYMNYWNSNVDYPGRLDQGAYPSITAAMKQSFARYAGGGGGGNQNPQPPPPVSNNGPVTVGQVTIQNQQNGLCLDTWGNNWELSQYDCFGGDNQKFDLIKYPDNSYALRNPASGNCLNNWGASSNDGAQQGQYACDGTESSRYWIWNNDNGQKSISNIGSNKCLDSGWYNYDKGNSEYKQYSCWSGSDQSFNINFIWGGY
jgi:hypothetical protein